MARQTMAQRLVTYQTRQPESRWGASYEAAIRATPQEAPRISRATILWPELLGREMHLLSTTEKEAAFLALHHPRVVDIHEQKVLSTVPAIHPLSGHALAEGMELTALEGTVRVAHRLNALSDHPKVFLSNKSGGNGSWVPFPFLGDLLLYIRDDVGIYCVNWNIKLTEADFLRRGPRPLGRVRSRLPDPLAELRHKIEEQYYADAGIRTIRITRAQFDIHLIANLRTIFGWHGRAVSADAKIQSQVCEWYRAYMDASTAAHELVQRAARHFGITPYEAKVILYRSIWTRKLLVDLYVPFLANQPIRPLAKDPFEAYGHWFSR